VVLLSEPTSNVTINLVSSDLTEGTVAPASLVFTPANWNVPQAATVTGVNDAVDDGDIGYTVVTSAVSSDGLYSGITVDDPAFTNEDDDVAGVTVNVTDGSTREDGETGSFTVVLLSEPTSSVTINLVSSDLTEGTVAPASLVFTPANWDVPQAATMTGVNDAVDDGDIAYTVVTSAVSSDGVYSGIAVDDPAFTNVDDDIAGVVMTVTDGSTTELGETGGFTVVLLSEPTSNVTVNLVSSDLTEGTVAPASLVFTPANWNIAQAAVVTGVADFLDDGDIAYSVVTTSVSTDPAYDGMAVDDPAFVNIDAGPSSGVTIVVIDATTTETGETGGFSVVLLSQPFANVTIELSSSDTTEGTVAPASLVFTPANWNVAQEAVVTGVDDLEDDGPVVFSIVTTATSADPLYDGIAVPDVAITNLDEDGAGFEIDASGVVPLLESGTSVMFTVVLTAQPSGDVTLPIVSADETEGTVSPSSLVFTPANWNIPQVVTVTGVDDGIDDGDMFYNVNLGPATSTDEAYNGLVGPSLLFQTVDDDTAGFLVDASGVVPLQESGTSTTFSLALTAQPSGDVTIPIVSADESEGTVSPLSLVFTPANWDVPQLVTVTGVDDEIDDGNQIIAILIGLAVSDDPAYAGTDPADVSVTNEDDDTAGVDVSPASGATTEAGGTATFSVALTSEPTAVVTIELTSSDPSEGTVTPAVLVFTPDNWNVPQVATVTGADDLEDDGDVAFSIVTTCTSVDPLYNLIEVPDVAVTNIDDDDQTPDLEITSFDVQKGAIQRSFIRYVDLGFSISTGLAEIVASVNDADPANDRIRMTRRELDGTGGTGFSLSDLLDAVDTAIEFDFGALGITGAPNTNAGDGYYEIDIDLDGDGTFDATRRFFRLLGDANGSGLVDELDVMIVNAALGQAGANLEGDMNGDGVVNQIDRILVRRALGRRLSGGLSLDD
jgi:hypothetical protein